MIKRQVLKKVQATAGKSKSVKREFQIRLARPQRFPCKRGRRYSPRTGGRRAVLAWRCATSWAYRKRDKRGYDPTDPTDLFFLPSTPRALQHLVVGPRMRVEISLAKPVGSVIDDRGNLKTAQVAVSSTGTHLTHVNPPNVRSPHSRRLHRFSPVGDRIRVPINGRETG